MKLFLTSQAIYPLVIYHNTQKTATRFLKTVLKNTHIVPLKIFPFLYTLLSMGDYHKEKNLKRIGENIRAARKSKNLTIETLSELAGISESFLGTVERGESSISIETLTSLCKILDVSADSLIMPGKESTLALSGKRDTLLSLPLASSLPIPCATNICASDFPKILLRFYNCFFCQHCTTSVSIWYFLENRMDLLDFSSRILLRANCGRIENIIRPSTNIGSIWRERDFGRNGWLGGSLFFEIFSEKYFAEIATAWMLGLGKEQRRPPSLWTPFLVFRPN